MFNLNGIVMKKLISPIAATLLILSSCSVFAESYGPQHDAIETLFKSDSEKTTKDAVWTSNRIFKVGVLNNGSNRDGYADYVCQVMYEYGFKGKSIWVQVIDIAQLVKTNKWIKLGEAHCD
jgi:hypothetical protein